MHFQGLSGSIVLIIAYGMLFDLSSLLFEAAMWHVNGSQFPDKWEIVLALDECLSCQGLTQ